MHPMFFLDHTRAAPAENLALDEALLLGGQEVLRLWEWPTPAAVLGAGCLLTEDVEEERCAADGVPILRRASGGGTVLLGRGCLLFSLVLALDHAPEMAHIGASYRYILERIVSALGVPELHAAGISDLALGSLKVSGNAQQRKRTHLLHHGTLLYAFDGVQVTRYLRMPRRQPEYREQRPHGEFLGNLPLSRESLAERLRRAFAADEEGLAVPEELVRQLVATKYGLAEWTRRR